MATHVILGKGPIGRTLAQELASGGHDVVIASRSGGAPAWRGPAPDGSAGSVTHAAVDATDAGAVADLAAGAVAIHSCLNPPYHRWPAEWPALHEATLLAGERSGAVVVMAGNLYGYGAGTHHMTEASPLASTERKGRVRAQMWAAAEQWHRAGRVRVTEVRGSDYLGPEAEEHAHAGARMLRPLLAGRTVQPVGRPDVLHSWTYLPDFARAMARAAVTEQAWGRAWHVPSPEPLTFRDVARRFAAAAGLDEPRVRAVPMPAVRLLGLVLPQMRELARVGYQHSEPFVMDTTTSEAALGLAPTPWEAIVAETLAAFAPVAPAVTRP